MNHFHNSAASAIMNIPSLLCFIYCFLLYSALNTAHDGVGGYLLFFSEYFQISGLICVQ